MLNFTFSAGAQVPEGNYYAEFVNVEDYQDVEKKYEPGSKWVWKITSPGEHLGKAISRITGRKATLGNACGKMIIALLGKTPKDGDAIDLQGLVGKKYLCTIAKTQGGSCRVETVVKMPD